MKTLHDARLRTPTNNLTLKRRETITLALTWD